MLHTKFRGNQSTGSREVFFFFFFFYVPFKIISLISRRANQKVGRKREYPGKNHLTHPQVELDLSYLWPVWGSNHTSHSGEMIEWSRAIMESATLNHSATGPPRKILKDFTIYGHGGPSGNVTTIVSINFHFLVPESLHIKFGFGLAMWFLRKASFNFKCKWPWPRSRMTLTFNTHISSLSQ